MPRVPQYQGDQIRTRPITRVLRQGPVPGQFGEQFGQTLARLGADAITTAQEIQEAEQQRANRLTVVTAEKQFNDLDEIWLRSKDKGVLQMVGKDPYQKLPETKELWDQQAGEIVKAAKNENQRIALEELRDRRRVSFMTQAESHATSEFRVYEKGEYEAARISAKNAAVAAAAAATALTPDGRPAFLGVVNDQLALQESIIRAGGVEIYGGPARQQAIIEQDRSETHVGVISALMGADHAEQALAYFSANKDQINPAQRGQLEAQLTAQTREQKAFAAANQVYDTRAPAPSDDHSPIQLDVMEDDLRALFKHDPKGYDLAVSMLRNRVAGEKDGRAARNDEREQAVWGAVFQGQPLAAVRKIPAYHDLPPKAQNDVVEYYRREADRAESRLYQAEAREAARESRAAARENREVARLAREEREKTITHMAEYYQLVSDPVQLRRMTVGSILALQKDWGSDLTGKLLKEREDLGKSDVAVRNAQLDQQIFVDTATNAGLLYVKKTPTQQSKEEKANLARLRTTVMDAIVYEQVTKNRVLSDSEKRDVMQRILDTHVMLSDWGADTQAVAALVREDDFGIAYLEIEDIPDTKLREILNYLRSKPRSAGVTETRPPQDDELKRRYNWQIQRAGALRVLGKSFDEVKAVLDGTAK